MESGKCYGSNPNSLTHSNYHMDGELLGSYWLFGERSKCNGNRKWNSHIDHSKRNHLCGANSDTHGHPKYCRRNFCLVSRWRDVELSK